MGAFVVEVVVSVSTTGLQLLRTDDFTGGLNLRANAFQLGKNESPDLLNVDIDPRGGFASRVGAEQLTTDPLGLGAPNSEDFTPTEVCRVYAWNRKNPQLIVTTKSQFCVSEGGVYDNFNMQLEVGGTHTWGVGLEQFEQKDATDSLLYGCSTIYGGFTFNGTTTTDLTQSGPGEWQDDLSTPSGTHMPLADHIAAHVDRMWVASTVEDGTAYPYRLRFSHPLFPQSWRELDYIDIPDGGTQITGITSFNGNLIVFKDHGLFILSGYSTDTFQLIPISLKHGCVNPLAFAELDGVLYFFDGTMGLFAFDGVRLQNLFEPIAPAFEKDPTYTSGDNWTLHEWANIRVWVGGRRVWLSDIDGKATYVFDPTLGRGGAWTRYRMSDGNAFGHGCDFNGLVVYSSGAMVPYAELDNRNVILYRDKSRYDEYWDGGNHLYDSYYTSRWQDAGNISVKKRWRRIDMVCKQPNPDYASDYDIDVKAFYDWQEGAVRRTSLSTVKAVGASNPFIWGVSNWGEANWGGVIEGAQYVRSAPLGPARAVQVKISGPHGVPWGVDSLTYKFNFRRLKA